MPDSKPLITADGQIVNPHAFTEWIGENWPMLDLELSEDTEHGFTVVDLDDFEPNPRRKTGTAQFRQRASLVHYVTSQVETPALYANPDKLTVDAVFDDHVGAKAGWRQFRAVLQLLSTPEWNAWTALDKAFHSAEDLAEFIEQWRHTIAEPSHADLLKLIRSFRATRNVTFRDETIDQSGDRSLEYVVETTAGGKGELQVPDSLTLVLAPFEGAEEIKMTARFRYRLDHGAAIFGVVLEQPDKVARDAFQAELETLSDDLLGITVMVGRPAE